MKKSKGMFLFAGIFLVLALVFLSSNFVSAESNICCEKLTTGQWCQSVPAGSPSCDSSYRQAPTSCESTAWCSVGTCYDSQQGLCDKNVPSVVCQNDGGVWDPKPPEELPQCQLGCCTLGANGANLVTQVRCKALSAQYGIQTNFNPGITSEAQCLATVGGDTKGACVYEAGAERTCRLLTKTECNQIQGNVTNTGVEFFEGYLCSNEELGTNCGPSEETRCVLGQDEVYFVDTCGNLANIYDANKINEKAYWATIIQKEDSCGFDSSNAGSRSCGNCDYVLGSTCSFAQRGEPQPVFGENFCRDLGCTYSGVKYEHGESWCGEAPGTPKITDPNEDGNYVFNGNANAPDNTKENLPGSVFTKLTCYNGEVTSENCYDGRQKVCIQGEVNGFKNAVCGQNLWQDCALITNQAECMDRELRKCNWVPGAYSFTEQKTEGVKVGQGPGACVPLNAPGFDFYEGSGSGDAICSIGVVQCDYVISKAVFGGSSFDKGSECIVSPDDRRIRADWAEEAASMCMSLGDCGPKINYAGKAGQMQSIAEKWFTQDGEGDPSLGDQIRSDGKTVLHGDKTYLWSAFVALANSMRASQQNFIGTSCTNNGGLCVASVSSCPSTGQVRPDLQCPGSSVCCIL